MTKVCAVSNFHDADTLNTAHTHTYSFTFRLVFNRCALPLQSTRLHLLFLNLIFTTFFCEYERRVCVCIGMPYATRG